MNRKIFLVVALVGACHSSRGDSAAPDAREDGRGEVAYTGVAGCMQACDQDHAEANDRVTCRLECEGADEARAAAARPVVAQADGGDAVGRAGACIDGCYGEGGGGEGACVGACKGEDSDVLAVDVLDRLGTCIGGCHADRHLSPTNRATCELNCEQVARASQQRAGL